MFSRDLEKNRGNIKLKLYILKSAAKANHLKTQPNGTFFTFNLIGPENDIVGVPN